MRRSDMAHHIAKRIIGNTCRFDMWRGVKGFDNFTVILDSAGKQQLVYKHAISTITPAKPIAGYDFEKKDENKE